MNSPWDILGVARDCSKSELKQAYARLLKLHRPDKDPEGFRRIREAYEWLRANGGSVEPATMPISHSTQPLTENAIQDAEKAADIERSADSTREPQRDRDAERKPPEPQRTSVSNDEPVPKWRADFNSAIEYSKTEKWAEALDRIDELRRELSVSGSPAAAGALVECAKIISLVHWNYAEHLRNTVVTQFPELARHAQLVELGTLIRAGREIQSIPARERSTLAQSLATHSAHLSDQKMQWAVQAMCDLAMATTAQAYFRARFPQLGIHGSNLARKHSRNETAPSSGHTVILAAIIVIVMYVISRLH